MRLTLGADGVVRLDASFAAELVQECVVTLEPVPSSIAEEFTLLFAATRDQRTVVLDSAEETVEPLADGRIDIGEAVAQQLSLALDPYPRRAPASIRRLRSPFRHCCSAGGAEEDRSRMRRACAS